MTETLFCLAIDLGTSRVAAATARVAADGSIATAPFALGRKSDSTATVVFVGDDGDLAFGDTAERRGVAQPERLIREFKRSVGDDVPISVAGTALRAEHLYARTVADIVALVTEREGAPPTTIALTHPTAWGAHRLALIRSALRDEGIADVELITEPEAAARHYEASRPVEAGQTLAVYDLGGGTFDTVLLRKETDGTFDLVGVPVGIDDLGGADFDDAVLRHVIATSEIDVAALSPDDPDMRLALAQLRRECVEAKEALSFDSDATVPVLLPPQRTSVRLTRSEFEDMITASIDRTVDALEDALDSAGLEPDQLESILLIGGSSRIPRVAQRLSERLDRPIAVDADPKAAIALGAARTALARTDHLIAPATPAALALLGDVGESGALAVIDDVPAGELVPAGGPAFPTAADERSMLARATSPLLLAGAALTIAAAIVFASTMSAGSRTGDEPIAAEVSPSATADPSPTPSATPAEADAEVHAEAGTPVETVADTSRSTRQRDSAPRNPRRSAMQQATEQSKGATKPSGSTSPGSTNAQPPSNPGSTPGTSTPTPGTSTPSPTPGTTSPTPSTPAPDPTTATPDPGSGTTPTPTPTTNPEPEPTQPPAPEPEPEPEPEPSPPPAEPEPSPSPTEPV